MSETAVAPPDTAGTLPESAVAPPDHTAGAEPHTDPRKAGMLAFLLSEVAFFSTLIMGYVVYMGKSNVGPYPAAVFSLPLVVVATIALLSSSGTIHMAERALHAGSRRGFQAWLALTILLGLAFIAGTAYEWYELIYKEGLTIDRNLFGTTYFTLVGFHAFHVSVGIFVMCVFLGLSLCGPARAADTVGFELTGWYWHFVDVVWVIVFTVVYIVSVYAVGRPS